VTARPAEPFGDDFDVDEPVHGDPDTDTAPRSEEGPPQTDSLAHAETGTSEFSRRTGGALSSELIADQFAELDRELESEHAQDPDEQGVTYLTRATQDEPAHEPTLPKPEEEEND
jgi:hypothetical protein